MRSSIGFILGVIARLWLATLRVRIVVDERLLSDTDSDRAWVLCFFHGTQFPLLAWPRRKKTTVMVSYSRDGEMQSTALRMQGLQIVRGSSSRGGARGLAALVRAMRRGSDAAFAVDGPRGPYGVAKAGAIVAAKSVDGWLVPMGSACVHGWTFERAWDKFTIPCPFSRVAVVLGSPLDAASTPFDLKHAIQLANEVACRALTRALDRSAAPQSGV